VFFIYSDYTTTVASEALTAVIARHPSCEAMKEAVVLLDISDAKKKKAKILLKEFFQSCSN
jgi:hypothetical protein